MNAMMNAMGIAIIKLTSNIKTNQVSQIKIALCQRRLYLIKIKKYPNKIIKMTIKILAHKPFIANIKSNCAIPIIEVTKKAVL